MRASFGPVIIAPDIPEHLVQARTAPSGRRMATPREDLRLEMIFSRAFLLELERGDVQNASIFARAFLKQHADREAPN